MIKKWAALALVSLALLLSPGRASGDSAYPPPEAVTPEPREPAIPADAQALKKYFMPLVRNQRIWSYHLPLVRGDPVLIFSDNFSAGNKGWGPVFDAGGAAGIVSSQYSLSHSLANQFLASIAPVPASAFSNRGYSIQADMNLVHANDSRLGFIFDWVSNANFYLATVKPSSGEYVIYQFNGSYNSLASGSSALIAKGVAKNALKLVRKPASIELWILSGANYVLLASANNPRVQAGQAGLQLTVYSGVPSEARYDNVSIYNFP